MVAVTLVGTGISGSLMTPSTAPNVHATENESPESATYLYTLQGFSYVTFATIDVSMTDMTAKINTQNVTPHYILSGKYASILIQNRNGAEKYDKTYLGNALQAAGSDEVSLSVGDFITVYHAEHQARLFIQDDKNQNLAHTKTTVSYEVTSAGLKLVDNLDVAIAQNKAESAVSELFTNSDVTGTIKDSTNQEAINNAKELVAAVTDTSKKAELEVYIVEAQKQLDTKIAENTAEQARQKAATGAVKSLFNNNDVTGVIKESVNQEAINQAKELVTVITDANEKAELEAYIEEAQKQLDAKTAENVAEQARQEAATGAVKGLFNNNDVTGIIKDSTTQEIINNAKELVASITDKDKNAALEIQIAEAQKQLDTKTAENAAEQARQTAATDASKDLFNNNDVTGTIKDSVTQEAIDNAKELVATITDADKKAELETQIVEAQKQLTDRVTGTGNTFTLKQDRYLTGNYTGNTTAMSVDVNGKRYYGGTVKDGEFSFYALDKIAKETDEIIVNLHGVDKSIKTTFSVTVKSLKKDAATTSATFTMGEKNIVGTVTGDIKTFGVTIDGKLYYGGTISPDGTFKFYAYDKKIKVGSVVTIVGYDASRTNVLSEGNVEILK